jgi:AAA+ ATPase superfamily predicted ATPase
MDPVKNPFAPGAGSPPPELAGREDLLERARITLLRLKEGRHAKSLMLLGLRGVGKTVLLNQIKQIAEREGYLTSFVEATENRRLARMLIPELRRLLFALNTGEKVNALAKRALGVLGSFIRAAKIKVDDVEFGIDIDPVRGEADSGDLEADLAVLFAAVGEAAKSKLKAILILIDEVQYLNEEDLSALIMAIHRVNQNQLPFVVIGAGLPQLAALAGNSKSYAERLFDYPSLGPLTDKDIDKAVREPIEAEDARIEDGALLSIREITRGYPYFLQAWGYQVWNEADHSPITSRDIADATPKAVKQLDESFFRVRFDRLTPSEKRYLRAMAELGEGPHRSGDIAQILKKEVRSVAPLRNGLIRKGMIYSPAHGDTAFTVPMFDEYLKRVMPQLN